MPLSKQDYEKVVGRSLTDAEYQSLAGIKPKAGFSGMSQTPGADMDTAVEKNAKPIGLGGFVPTPGVTSKSTMGAQMDAEETRLGADHRAADKEIADAAKKKNLPAPPPPAPKRPEEETDPKVLAQIAKKPIVMPGAPAAINPVQQPKPLPMNPALAAADDEWRSSPANPANKPVMGMTVVPQEPENEYAAVISAARKKWGL